MTVDDKRKVSIILKRVLQLRKKKRQRVTPALRNGHNLPDKMNSFERPLIMTNDFDQ